MHLHIHARTHAYIHKCSYCFFLWLRETAYNPKLSRTQPGLNSQSSERGNIFSCQLSSTFDSRHRVCANKHSPKGGDVQHRYTHAVCYSTGKHSNRTCSHPPMVVHHRPANRNAVVTGTLCIVVNQLPRWNWHRFKQSVDYIDLCPCATVHTHAKAWTHACRHIWRQACMPEHTNTGTQTDGHAYTKLFWIRLPIHISLYEWLEAALIEINWVLSRHVYSHVCIIHWFVVWFGSVLFGYFSSCVN